MTNSLLPKRTVFRGVARRIPYPWIVVGLALVGQMGGAWPVQGLPILYPFIQDELSLTRAQVGLITSALMGAGMTTVLLGGWLTDVVGVRRVVSISLLALGLLLVTIPLAGSLALLLIFVAFAGLAEGPTYPATSRAVLDWIPRQTRGLAMSIKQIGPPLGGAIASAALPAIAVAWGWGPATVLLGGLVFGTGVVFVLFYRDAPLCRTGVARISCATLASLARDRGMAVATAWAFAFAAIQFVLLTYLVLYLVNVIGLKPGVAGGYLAAAFMASIAARITWGAVSDFLFGGRRVVVMSILGLSAAGSLAAISLTGPDTPQGLVFLTVIALGLTVHSWAGLSTTLIGELAIPHAAGTTLGAVSMVIRVSMITMPPLFGLLVDLSGSYTLGWATAASVALASTLVLARFGREPHYART